MTEEASITNRAGAVEEERPRSRKEFLRWSGAGLATLALAACDDDDIVGPGEVTIDLSDDVGILNFAYALEQLEAAFYTQVVANPYAGITQEEARVMQEIRDHEIVHREFLAVALGGGAIPALEVDFDAIDFDARASVLGAARTFEDLGVGAYNGAGQFLASADFLLVAGKIVSVEARHAAAIRDLLQPSSPFSIGDGNPDVVDMNGLDRALAPQDVLDAAAPFIATEITLTT